MPKNCTNTWRLISCHPVNYASSLITATKEPKNTFYTSPGMSTQDSGCENRVYLEKFHQLPKINAQT